MVFALGDVASQSFCGRRPPGGLPGYEGRAQVRVRRSIFIVEDLMIT